MCKFYFTIFLLVITGITGFSQAVNIQWQKAYGGEGDDFVRSVKQTSDGGFVLGGHTRSPLSGNLTEDSIGVSDYWVVKIDALGNIEWQNLIGGTEGDHLYDIQQTPDNGYILAGYSYSEIGFDKTEPDIGDVDRTKKDYWILRLNDVGEILWQNTIGGDLEDNLWSVDQTTDGGFILGGYSASYISEDKVHENFGPDSTTDYWVVKTDVMGTVEWTKTIGGTDEDELYTVVQTTDGGYILGGGSASPISGNKTSPNRGEEDYWLVKIDNLGEITWQKTIGGDGEDELRSVVQTTDGGYVLAGYSDSEISGDKTMACFGKTDYWVVKTDALGNIEWQNSFGGSAAEQLHSIIQTAHGNYLAAGFSSSNVSGNKTSANKGKEDYWVVKIGSNGELIWQKSMGGDNHDKLYSIYQASDNSYICSGHSTSGISIDKTIPSFGEYDIWAVKLTADESVAVMDMQNNELLIYPNPATNLLHVEWENASSENCIFEIVNITGQIIKTIPLNSNNIAIDIQDLNNGVYFYRVRNKDFIGEGNFIKL